MGGFFGGGGGAFPYKLAFGLISATAAVDPNSVNIDGATVAPGTGDYTIDVTSAGFTTWYAPFANGNLAAAGNGVIAVPKFFSLTLVTLTLYDNAYVSTADDFSIFIIGV